MPQPRMSALFLALACICATSALAGNGRDDLLTIGVFGDINGTECQPKYPPHSVQMFDRMLAHAPLDHILLSGDAVHGECTSYSGSAPYAQVVASMWKEFDEQFVQKSARLGLSLVLAPGNHDAPFLWPGSREFSKIENEEFQKYWLANRKNLKVEPVNVPGYIDRYPYYWAYTFQNILFVVLHSTKDNTLPNAAEQKMWLRALFKTTAAKRARFKIAVGHVPPYAVLDPSVGSKYSSIIKEEQVGKPDSLMDILLDNQVGLLVVGHSHAPYPAMLTRNSDKKRLMVLSMPCGHSPRKLFKKGEPAEKGFAVLKISDANKLTVTVHEWQNGALIPHTYYPASIPTEGAAVKYQKIPETIYR